MSVDEQLEEGIRNICQYIEKEIKRAKLPFVPEPNHKGLKQSLETSKWALKNLLKNCNNLKECFKDLSKQFNDFLHYFLDKKSTTNNKFLKQYYGGKQTGFLMVYTECRELCKEVTGGNVYE